MKAFELRTGLMAHQRKAVDKLMAVKVGALFMDMGTGKTLTAMEIIRRRAKKFSHVVWICPVSLKHTIAREIQKHTTEPQNVFIFDDKVRANTIPKADWYIVGAESIGSSDRVFSAFILVASGNTFVVVDESLTIKSPTAKRTQRITDATMVSAFRLILTGTPLAKGVQDLYSQMRFLSPLILGYSSFYKFAKNHLVYDDRYPKRVVEAHNTDYLARKINPFLYQVKKEECLDLPDKTYSTVNVLDLDIRFSYDAVKTYYINKIQRMYETQTVTASNLSLTIFAMMLRLQMVLSGFEYSGSGHFIKRTAPANRIQALKSVIDSTDTDEKIIIWAKFHHDLDVICHMLAENYGEDSVVEFSGRKNTAEKEEALSQFRSGARFFVATASSGGYGLTLNEASYVVYYNNTFKYSDRLQSEDRCHRIGQTKHVTYVDLCTMETIDERIMKCIKEKKDVLHDFQADVEQIKDDQKAVHAFIQAL